MRLLSQLFGDRAVIANATGCSSIYGGNLPTTPYTTRSDGRGPAWSNSLFEDAAEFGLGMRLTADKLGLHARELLRKLDKAPLRQLLENPRSTSEEIDRQRAWLAEVKDRLNSSEASVAQRLSVADYLVKRSVWVIGGDGWAYDIGFGGLDHVLASGKNVNVLVLDTEVYSNTGGQLSKSTPMGAIAKFAQGGKLQAKKNLGLMISTYGYVYVARVAMGYSRTQTIKAFVEAEAYDGPSLIIAYCHCVPEHGIGTSVGLTQQKAAVESGMWPLFRFLPDENGDGEFVLDSREPSIDVSEYIYKENRFNKLRIAKPDVADRLLSELRAHVRRQYKRYLDLERR